MPITLEETRTKVSELYPQLEPADSTEEGIRCGSGACRVRDCNCTSFGGATIHDDCWCGHDYRTHVELTGPFG